MKQIIQFNTIIGCPNNCSYCPQKTVTRNYKKLSKQKIMTMDTFITCYKKLPGGIEIAFGGYSEPFLNPDCSNMILYANQHNSPIQVNTTLVGLTTDDVDRIKDVDFSSFLVHLPNKKDFFMEKKKLIDVLIYVCKGIHKNLGFVYFNDIDQDILKTIKDFGYEPIVGTINSRCGKLYGSQHILGYGFCEMHYMKWHVILPDGSVSLCCMDFGLHHILGNLLFDDFSDLYKKKEWLRLKHDQKTYDSDILCRDCEFFVPYMNPRFFVYIGVNMLKKFGYGYNKN